MKEFYASVTERGRVTPPIKVRKGLGVQQGDDVVFVIGDGGVALRKRWTVRNLGGSVPALRHPEDWEARIREAKEERAARLVEEMRQGNA